MESGFQYQRATRLRQMLRQSKAARRARRLHDQFVSFPDTFQILGTAEYALCFHSTSSCQRKFLLVLAVHHHIRKLRPQNKGDKLSKLSIAQDCSAAKFLDIDLIENFARGGQWLDENGLFIGNRIGDEVQVLQGQCQIFGKGAVMRDDAQDGPVRTMRLQSAPAKNAHRPIAVSRASHINLAYNTSPQPTTPFTG